MKKTSKFSLAVILVVGIILASPNAILASSNIKVLLEGQELIFDVPPQVVEGRTLLPLRGIFEALGLSVGWDNKTRTITGIGENTEIILKLDNIDVKVNGINKTLDVPAKVINGRTLVPVRFIAESLNMNVDWQSESQIVSITSIKAGEHSPIPINQTQTDIIFIGEENSDKLLIEEYGFSIEIPHSWRGYFTIEKGNWIHESGGTIDFTFIYDNMEISNIFSIIMLERSDEIDEDYASEMWQYLATDEKTIYTSSHLMELPEIFNMDKYDTARGILTKMVNDDLTNVLKTFKLNSSKR